MNPDRDLRIINLGAVTYSRSQSVYHAVAACMSKDTPDTIILCRPQSPYLCIGFHQSSLQVLDRSAVERLGLPVMRRRLGGGLTYLDCQQQFYQCVFHRSRSPVIPPQVYQARLRPPIEVLRKIGLRAELRYTNEIEISGRRIAGIGGGVIAEASVVVGNILNEFDYQSMAAVVNAPCREFREMTLSAMRQRITTLSKEGCTAAWPNLPELLIEAYERWSERTAFHGELTDQEHEESVRQGEVMMAKTYLEQVENIDLSLVFPLVRLKVSGSTFIRLVLVRLEGRLKFAVLAVRDGRVEQMRCSDELGESASDSNLQPGIPVYEIGEIRVGHQVD